MATVPASKEGKIDFYAEHAPVWTANLAGIGLVAADTTALAALVTAAQAKQSDRAAAVLAAKAATVAYDESVVALQRKGSELIQKIKVAAAGSPTPGAVYALAQIPPPALPSPVGNPGTPTDLKVTLNPDGSIVLTWKCANPPGSAGTIYNLRRKVAGAFVAIGGAGGRKFVDETIPAGTASAVYEITAVRSTRAGTAGVFLVNFGVSTAGEAFASVAQEPKLAA